MIRLIADFGMLVIFVSAYVVALDFPFRSARYPLVICSIGACLALASLVRDVIVTVRPATTGASAVAEDHAWDAVRALKMSIALLTLVPCVGIFGMLLGTVLWLPLMLHFVAGMRWHMAVLDTAIVAALLFVVDHTGLAALPRGYLM